MARIIGAAGATANMLAAKRWRRSWQLLVIALAAVIVLTVIGTTLLRQAQSLPSQTSWVVSLVVFGIVVGTMLWIKLIVGRVDRHLEKRTRDAKRGAKGEETIGALLASLSDDYVVAHDLAGQFGDIDHIVAGPTGVFVIETKAHGGQVTAEGDRVLVNGHPPEKDFLAQSWRNAYRLRDLLRDRAGIETTVTPILVFPNAYVRVRRPVKGVRVANKKYLLEMIRHSPPVELPLPRIMDVLQHMPGG